jgi:GNAT superfamily N-acetyltransferase
MQTTRRKEDPLPARTIPEDLAIIEIIDERSREAEEALELIAESFDRNDRHAISELKSEIEEKRHRLLGPFDFHLLAIVDGRGSVVATAAGVYLPGLNSGFITYLVVSRRKRGRKLGRHLRSALVDCFEANAEITGDGELRWVLGEVRRDSPWLMTLVRTGSVIPFDLEYFHPGSHPESSDERYVLYREVLSDSRERIPAVETARILYAIYRRAYRVRYPLERENFRTMIEQVEQREEIGPDPEVLRLASDRGRVRGRGTPALSPD